MSKFKDDLSDLKYYMSKDNTNGTRKWFICLSVIWVLAILLTVLVPVIWFVPKFAWVSLAIKAVITFGWVVTLVFGIIFWISLTKNS